MCYSHKKVLAAGALLVAGLGHFFPQARGALPISTRTLRAWGRVRPPEEGGPLSLESIGAVVLALIAAGHTVEAFLVLWSDDCYLREQDWMSTM